MYPPLKNRVLSRACRWLLALLACCASFAACADEVDDAIALLRAGKADAAYQLLEPLIDKQSDKQRFNLTLGAHGRPTIDPWPL